ncbi:unnamed protein product [Acanthosepion pharaonis]|uniref:Uncharacterized protein n=1 Tax=Acanthosepion pharaonis TaxID=158019 RepID=A0A812B267_ACAPH|nr:unnamed protein product [Sepia pharaonis]
MLYTSRGLGAPSLSHSLSLSLSRIFSSSLLSSRSLTPFISPFPLLLSPFLLRAGVSVTLFLSFYLSLSISDLPSLFRSLTRPPLHRFFFSFRLTLSHAIPHFTILKTTVKMNILIVVSKFSIYAFFHSFFLSSRLFDLDFSFFLSFFFFLIKPSFGFLFIFLSFKLSLEFGFSFLTFFHLNHLLDSHFYFFLSFFLSFKPSFRFDFLSLSFFFSIKRSFEFPFRFLSFFQTVFWVWISLSLSLSLSFILSLFSAAFLILISFFLFYLNFPPFFQQPVSKML